MKKDSLVDPDWMSRPVRKVYRCLPEDSLDAAGCLLHLYRHPAPIDMIPGITQGLLGI